MKPPTKSVFKNNINETISINGNSTMIIGKESATKIAIKAGINIAKNDLTMPLCLAPARIAANLTGTEIRTIINANKISADVSAKLIVTTIPCIHNAQDLLPNIVRSTTTSGYVGSFGSTQLPFDGYGFFCSCYLP